MTGDRKTGDRKTGDRKTGDRFQTVDGPQPVQRVVMAGAHAAPARVERADVGHVVPIRARRHPEGDAATWSIGQMARMLAA
jgi:hypothetical protein